MTAKKKKHTQIDTYARILREVITCEFKILSDDSVYLLLFRNVMFFFLLTTFACIKILALVLSEENHGL